MIFNSIDFAIFLPIVFLLYWYVTQHSLKYQNLLIVAASYFFYGWWDWRFLGLILFSTVVDYVIGVQLSKAQKEGTRKLLLWSSLLINLGFLGTFKYYNFFLENFKVAFSFFGTEINASSLDIILPVGISFYTFQTMSYSIDVYRKQLEPTTDFIAFAAFVSFFPQLVAGPIERATNLLPQFYNKRTFDYHKAVDGLKQILWGLFKKMVIADNCAELVNAVFESPGEHSGSTLLVGAIFFTFQIYGDFSGYSDIAIGTSRLFGFDLMRNFAFPYFSRDVAEFWRRWHISLSTWFRDYLYIPLGGSKGGLGMKIRNTFIIFIVSGFWHGANWTYIVWGALNAFYFLPLLLSKKNRTNIEIAAINSVLPTIKETLSILGTFALTVFAWIFFRASSMTNAFDYIERIFSASLFSKPAIPHKSVVYFIIIFTIMEWIGRREEFAIAKIGSHWPRYLRWIFYYAIISVLYLNGGQEKQFIYFQF